MKLSRKISLLIGILVFVISASLGVIILIVSQNVIKSSIEESLMLQASTGASLVEKTINVETAIVEELAMRIRTQSMDWQIQKESLFPDISRLGYLDIGVVNKEGIAHYVAEDTSADLSSRDYIMAAFSGKHVLASVISRVINKPVFMLASPIYSNDKIAGVLIARKEATSFHGIIESLGVGKNGYTYIIDKTGAIVSHENDDFVMNQFSPIKEAKTDASLASLAKAFTEILSNETGITTYNYNGKTMIAAYGPVANQDWYLVVTAESSEALAGITFTRNMLLIFTLLFLAIGIIAAIIIGNSMARPLIKMLPVLENIAAGNLMDRVNTYSKDEIGLMAKEFNSSIDSLTIMVKTTKNTSHSLEAIAERLTSALVKTEEAIKDISSNIIKVKDKTINQSLSVAETNSTAEKIKSNLEKLNASIENQSSAVIESSSAVEEMIANIKSVAEILQRNAVSMAELLNASETGKGGIAKVREIMKAIQNDSEGLIEATRMIQQIAQQTNLLAMNAAIEAAHAGDAGRGFAVVADEIRKLAENSSTQGKSISEVLGKLKTQINTADTLSDEAQSGFNNILVLLDTVQNQELTIKNAMQEQSAGSTELLQAMGQINEVTAQVKEESNEMLFAGTRISDEMRSLISTTDTMINEIDKISESTVEINTVVENLDTIIYDTKNNITSLSQTVDKFKTDNK